MTATSAKYLSEFDRVIAENTPTFRYRHDHAQAVIDKVTDWCHFSYNLYGYYHYTNGILHREDGPAVVNSPLSNLPDEYWLFGIQVPKEYYNWYRELLFNHIDIQTQQLIFLKEAYEAGAPHATVKSLAFGLNFAGFRTDQYDLKVSEQYFWIRQAEYDEKSKEQWIRDLTLLIELKKAKDQYDDARLIEKVSNATVKLYDVEVPAIKANYLIKALDRVAGIKYSLAYYDLYSASTSNNIKSPFTHYMIDNLHGYDIRQDGTKTFYLGGHCYGNDEKAWREDIDLLFKIESSRVELLSKTDIQKERTETQMQMIQHGKIGESYAIHGKTLGLEDYQRASRVLSGYRSEVIGVRSYADVPKSFTGTALYDNGTQYHFVAGELHNEAGPAVVFSTGKKRYYVAGQRCKGYKDYTAKLAELKSRLTNQVDKLGGVRQNDSSKATETTVKNMEQKSTMTKITETVKSDAAKAAYRMGARKLTQIVQNALIGQATANLKGKQKSNMVQSMQLLFSTDLGKALISITLGSVGPMLSTALPEKFQLPAKFQRHVDALTDELRVEGMADIGVQAMDMAWTLGKDVLPAITGLLSTIDEEVEKTRVEVEPVAAPRVVHAPADVPEVEMARERDVASLKATL